MIINIEIEERHAEVISAHLRHEAETLEARRSLPAGWSVGDLRAVEYVYRAVYRQVDAILMHDANKPFPPPDPAE